MMQINKDRIWKNYRRASLRLYIHHPYQLCHVTPSYAVPLAVCILMLPMLVVVHEHLQLATMNSMTFSHTPLALSSLNNVLPAMVLQSRVERSTIGYSSHSSSRSNTQCTSGLGLKVCSRRSVMVVMLLLLLLSGDIEMNPGPLGQEDLKSLHNELHPVSDRWFSLGIQLQVPTATLRCIRSDFGTVADCLLEMLTVWLQCTNSPPTWDILIEALESLPMGERHLAQQLRDKYCPRTEEGTTDGSLTLGQTFQPSAPQVQLCEHGNLLSSQTPLYQFALSAVPLVQPQVLSYCIVSPHLTPPEMTTFPHPPKTIHTGRHLSTTSCAHEGGESRYGEVQQIQDENSMSLVSGLDSLSVDGESVALPRHVEGSYQHSQSQHQPQVALPTLQCYHSQHQRRHQGQHCHHSSSQPSSQPLYNPSIHSPQVRHNPSHQPQAQSYTSHYPPFQLPLEQPSYQHTEHVQPSYYQLSHTFQQSYPPTDETPHYYPMHVRPTCTYMYQPFHQPSQPPLSVNLLGKYADFLRLCYVEHDFTSMKWPHLDSKNYVNLAVINNEYSDREELIKFRQQTIHGSIDDILEWKAPIGMKDILKPNRVYNDQQDNLKEYQVTQLLIEGAPGIGKSTFAWEVCQNWGQHQLFNEYSLVVLLKFRDKRVHEAKSVSDLFYHPNPKLLSEIVNVITTSGGNGVLIILEGFDEAPASKRTMDSIFVRLFIGQELPKATVILTTRPSASSELHELCKGKHSRRIEIVGFGKKEIIEYIQCAFSDEQSRSDFKVYLSLYPHIYSMMYVPLNSAIVIKLYKSCKSSGMVVPKTITQLYSSLIRTLLLRYLKDKEEYKDTCTNINSFKDLPQPVYNQFCEICKIAYTGIMSAETELIFQDLPSDFDPLGLMQSCPELYVDRGASVSYNFLHLTVQEYLAAYHISQQSRDEQVVFMRDNILELKVVVRFLAGLTELGRDLWDVVRGFACEDKRNIDTTFLSEEESFIKLEILHLLFESQDSSAITSVLSSDYVCFYDYDSIQQSVDWYVLGYCITHSSCDWKLESDKCKLESVELFLRALSLHQDQCQSPSTGKIKEMWLNNKEMWLRESDPAAVHLLVDSMSQLVVFHNLTHLGLVRSGLTSETCNLLSKQNLQHLEHLNLGWNLEIGRGGTVNLITSLTKFSTIRELHLEWTGIGFEDCKALSELLTTSKYIQVLDIGNEELDNPRLSPDSIHLIIDGLSHNTSLEKLNMSGSNFSSENVLHLASVLRANARLKELHIRGCNIQSSDSVHLAKALEENTTTQLQTLVLSGNPIGSEGAVAFASMLQKNQCLKRLDFYDDSVGVEGALELIESLKHNTTLEKLKLSEKCKPPSFSTLDKTLQDCVIFGEVLGEQSSDDQYISISKQVIEEHETMDQTIMHCIFVGPAGVGKSSLLKRLLHQKLNLERCITQLSEKSVRVEVIRDVSKMVAKVTGFEWKVMEDTDTQGFELIRQWFRKQKKVSKDSSTVDDSNHQVSECLNDQTIPGSEVREQLEKAFQENQSTVGSSNKKIPEQTGQVSQTEPLNISEDTTSSSHDSVVPQHSQHNKRMEFLLHVLREKGISGLRQHVDNPRTLYLTDSGGQPEFQELLPALVVGPCVFFVVFPIHEDLTLKHKVQYVRLGCTREYTSSLTVQEDILRSLASIASTKYLDIDGNEVKPKVLLIATFKDQVPLEEDHKKRLKFCNTVNFRRIEIVGFGKKEIDEYIQCAFSDEQSQSDFKEYLSLYPDIHSMMYVPLNSAIVTHVYESCKSSGTVVPKTMTQLYSSLIRTLLLRYLKGKEEYKDTCTNINTFKDLPRPVYDQFCEICKIAYTGLMGAETELIFQDLPSDFDPLGLMQTCPELYVDRGAFVSYNFLHLTVQEYLAAYHISQQSRDKQVAFMRQYIEANNLEELVQKSIEVKKLEVVVRFLTGISELGKDLSDAVMEFAIETRSTYFSLREEKIIRLEVLRWLFESQNPSAISRILGSDCVCFNYGSYGATPLDWYVLGYCINHSCCDWSLEMRVGELELFELLLKALNLVQDQCQLQTTGKIKRMYLYYSSPTSVRWLLENVHHNLTHLALRHTFLDSEDCDFLATHCDLLQHLEYLYLSDNYYIGRGGTVNLIVSLITFSTIRELGLSMTSIGFEDCKALSELLASCRYLEMLDISENTLSPDSIQLIIDGLSHNTSLEKVNMSDAMFGSENVLHLASVLRGNTRLRELIIGRCNIQSSDSVHLAKALEESTQLQVLCVEDDPIGTEGAVAFAGMLATNRSLVDVNMGYCEIQGEGAVHLAVALKNNSTVCVFNVTHNPIGSEGAVTFADMLATNSSLAELDVSECRIQEEGAVCLAKAMEHNSTLQCLDISYNPIGSKGALAFANMLKMNQCLKLLIVHDNVFHSMIGVEGALELIESLKHNTTLEELWLSPESKPPSFSTLDKALQDRVAFFY